MLAVGENDFGQLETRNWNGVIAVASGALHTLGLTADGHVLTTGDNRFHQCDLSLFSGVQSIRAGYYDSYCLLSGGRIMCSGYHEDTSLPDLSPSEHLSAGAYGTVISGPSSMTASHPSLALPEPCLSVAVSSGYAVGITADGRMVSSSSLIPQWEQICRVAAGENGVVALDSQGNVHAFEFGRHSHCDFTFTQPVIDIAAGPNHYAFLLADGTLEVRWRDGRCETFSP